MKAPMRKPTYTSMGWLRCWVIWVRPVNAAAMANAKTRTGLSSLVLSEMVELKYIWKETDDQPHHLTVCKTNLMSWIMFDEADLLHKLITGRFSYRNINSCEGRQSCMLGRESFPVRTEKDQKTLSIITSMHPTRPSWPTESMKRKEQETHLAAMMACWSCPAQMSLVT